MKKIIRNKEDWQDIQNKVGIAISRGVPFEITLDRDFEKNKPKTTPQLRYLHGVVIPVLKKCYEKSNGMTYTIDSAKLQLKQDCGFGDWQQVVMRGVPLPMPVFIPKSYASAKIEDIMHAIDKAKEIALIMGEEIPEPEDFKLNNEVV